MGDIVPYEDSAVEAVDHKSCENCSLHRQVFVEDHLNRSNKEITEMDLLMKNLHISDEDDLNDLVLQKHESALVEVVNESSVFAGNHAKDCVMPNAVSFKFVPAIKGSRALQGNSRDPNLHVKWAENVYDPPVTSSSHTMKGPRHRHPKAKIDHYKHRHMKTIPGIKRQSYRSSSSSISDPRMTRVQVLARRSVKIQSGDIAAAGGLESKCGGNFCAKSLWLSPLPIGEAS